MSERYSRQILFPEIGKAGQSRIRSARLTIVGCGALGTVSAEMLVRAGVGRLTLIDRDFVEESNLQRQSLFTESDARNVIPKAVAARKALRAINSEVEVRDVAEDLSFRNIHSLCRESDLLVDGTDNFQTRFLINDFSFQSGKPWVYGACVGSYGVSAFFRPGVTSCLRCLMDDPPAPGRTDTCDTAGIVGPVVHHVAAEQVTRVLKFLVGASMRPDLFQVDVWRHEFRNLSLEDTRRDDCPCCAAGNFRFLEREEGALAEVLCGRNAVQVSPRSSAPIRFEDVARRLEGSGRVQFNEHVLKFQVNGYDLILFPNGRGIIRGTDETAVARALYARYVGT